MNALYEIKPKTYISIKKKQNNLRMLQLLMRSCN